MAQNRLEAVLDIGLNVTKAEAEKVRKSLQGAIYTALPKNFRAIDLDDVFKFDGRSSALRAVRQEIDSLTKRAAKAGPEQARAMQGQLDALESIAQIERSRSDISREEIRAGERIARQLKERKRDYRQLQEVERQSLRRYQDQVEARSRQVKSSASKAEGLSGGGAPYILSSLREQQRALDAESAALKDLTDERKLAAQEQAESRRKQAEATRRQRDYGKALDQRRKQTLNRESDHDKARKQAEARDRDFEKALQQQRKQEERQRADEAKGEREVMQANTRQLKEQETARKRVFDNYVKAQKEESREIREAAKQKRAQARRERRAAERARARSGVGYIQQAGGVDGLYRDQLPDARTALEREISARERLQRNYARRGLGETQAYANNQEALTANSRALKYVNDQLRRFDRAATQTGEQIEEMGRKAARVDAKQSRRSESLAATRSRARYGMSALSEAGGPGAVGAVPYEDLPYVKDGIQRRLKAMNRLQDYMLRTGQANTEQFERNKRVINEYSDALQHAQQRMRGFASVVRESALFMRQFIRLGIGFSAVFSVINGVRALIVGLIELNRELKSIQAISQATDREMRTIGGAIRSVAQETIYNTTEIAKATQTLAQAGVEVKDIPRALKATAQFASGTASDIETSADLLTTMSDVFDNLDFGGASDQLTQTLNVSKTSAADLKTIVSTSASTAKQFEVGSKNYLAGVSVLRNAGLKASTVGTGLRRVMIDLFTPDDKIVGQLQKRYEEIGQNLTEAQIRGRFYAFSKQRDPLVAALRELQSLGYNQGEAKQSLQSAFDIRSRNVLSALVGDLSELERLGPQIQIGNAALSASQTQMESLANSAKNLGAAITVMADSLSGDAVPALAELTRELTDVVQGITDVNEGMKEATGSGLGSALLGGAGAGVISFATTRGSFGRKIANAAGGAVAGTGASIAAPSSSLSNFANSLLSIIAGPAFVAALGSAIGKGLEISTRFSRGPSYAGKGQGRVNRGGVNNTGRPGRPGMSAAGAVNAAANTAGVLSMFGKRIVRFFGSIGSIVTKLFSPLTDVFRIIGNFASRVPALARVASFAARWANPFVGGVLTIISVVGALRSLFQDVDGEDVAKRLEASQKRFQKEVSRYNAELDQIRQFELTDNAPENSAAAALQELDSRRKDLAKAQSEFLGGTVQNLDEVRAIFEQLSSSRGSVQGSDYRQRLLDKLANELVIVDGNGNPIEITSDSLAQNAAAVRSLSETITGVDNQAEGLQKALVKMIQLIQDKPVDQLNDAQKALKDVVDNLTQDNYEILTGLRETTPERLSNLLNDVFDQVSNTARSQLESADIDGQVEELSKTIASGKLSPAQIQDKVQTLTNTANNLRISTVDFLDSLETQIEQASEELARSTRNARISAQKRQARAGGVGPGGIFVSRGNSSLGDVDDEPLGTYLTDSEADRARVRQSAIDAGLQTVRTQQDSENRAIESSRKELQNEVEQQVEVMKTLRQSEEFQRYLKNQVGNYKQTALDSFNAVTSGEDAIVRNDETGYYEASSDYKRARQLQDQFVETQQKNVEEAAEAVRTYRDRNDLARQEFDYGQKLNRLKSLQAPLQAQLNALNGQQRAREAQIQDQLAFQIAQRAEAGDDLNKQIRIDNAISGLKERLHELHSKQVEQRLELLDADYQQRQSILSRDGENAIAEGDFSALNEARAQQRRNEEDYLAARAESLRKQNVSEDLIRADAARLRAERSFVGESARDAQRAFDNSRSGIRLSEIGHAGFSSGDAQLDAFRQQQGYAPSNDDRTQLLKERLALLQENVDKLREQKRANRGNTEEMQAYEQQIRKVRSEIGNTRGELQDLGSSGAEQLRKGFDPTQLINSLQQSNSGIVNLGNSIRTNLVGSVDAFADSMTRAQTGASSFADGVTQAFQSLADGVLRALNRAFANQLAQKFLGFAFSAFSPGVGASTQASMNFAGIDAQSIANNAINPGGYAKGGIVRGPGTGTSDSVPSWLSDGEGVLTAKAVDMVGEDFIHRLNSGVLPKYKNGGVVGRNKPAPKQSEGGGESSKTVVNIENHTNSKPQTKRRKGNDGTDIIDIVIQEVADDVLGGGRVGQAVLKTTDAGRRLTG